MNIKNCKPNSHPVATKLIADLHYMPPAYNILL